MSSGHHIEPASQVTAITANITRGRDVLAALAAAWSSSANQLDPDGAADTSLLNVRPDPTPTPQAPTRVSQ
jgi:hypothetical protein